MCKRVLVVGSLGMALLAGLATWAGAQESEKDPPTSNSVIRVLVSMVQLNVAVIDQKGNYVTGLHPSDFVVTEDGIPQKVASFEEGTIGAQSLPDATREPTASSDGESEAIKVRGPEVTPAADSIQNINNTLTGSNVFILFDTSNYMFRGRGFVFAQDSIAEFVRSLDHPYRVAFYSYSRDLYRAASLTTDRNEVLRGVRQTVNGDDSALYNALLMTLKDAAQYSGRKVIVVFSNGPDDSSMVSPEDVDELAQSEGIPIYMISTRDAKLDPESSAVFTRMTASTGGEAYFAKNWKDQRNAFAAIRDDLAHLYYMTYYPQPNPNRGWRAISVKLVNPQYKKLRIRTRSGYRPVPMRVAAGTADPQQP